MKSFKNYRFRTLSAAENAYIPPPTLTLRGVGIPREIDKSRMTRRIFLFADAVFLCL